MGEMHFVFRTGEVRTSCLANGGQFEKTDYVEKEPDEAGRLLPEFDERANFAVVAGVEDPFVPEARAFGEFGMLADDVKKGEKHADCKGFRVLGHEEDMRAALVADFVDEFGEAAGVREIEDGVRFSTVTIPAADDDLVPAFGELQGGTVFVRGADATEFQSVNVNAELGGEVG